MTGILAVVLGRRYDDGSDGEVHAVGEGARCDDGPDRLAADRVLDGFLHLDGQTGVVVGHALADAADQGVIGTEPCGERISEALRARVVVQLVSHDPGCVACGGALSDDHQQAAGTEQQRGCPGRSHVRGRRVADPGPAPVVGADDELTDRGVGAGDQVLLGGARRADREVGTQVVPGLVRRTTATGDDGPALLDLVCGRQDVQPPGCTPRVGEQHIPLPDRCPCREGRGVAQDS